MDVIRDASSLTPRRMEIITGVERRRRWTAQAKAEIVAETFAPGATVAEVARRHDLRASQIQLWRKQARTACAPAFAPVVVSEDATSAPAGAVLDIVAGAIRIAVLRPPCPFASFTRRRRSIFTPAPGSPRSLLKPIAAPG